MDHRDHDYSTLEVAPEPPLLHKQDQGKYFAAYDNTPPEAVSKPESLEVVPKQEYIQTVSPYSDTSSPSLAPYSPQKPPPAAPGARIWGLRRKTFLIVLAVLLVVVIGAVVGGAVGATVGKKGSKSAEPASATSTAKPAGNSTDDLPEWTSAISEESQLSAINWTDSTGVAYHGVFWQATNDHLMVSIRNMKTDTWEVVNITASLDKDNTVAAKTGTPLAAGALGWPWTEAPYNQEGGLILFFLSPRNLLQSLVADLPGKEWVLGELTTSALNYETHPDTQIALWWSLCSTNCTNELYVWYQDEDQWLRQGHNTNWYETPKYLVQNLNAGGAIGVTAVTPDYGRNGTDAWSPRVYYEQSSSITELVHDNGTVEQSWFYGATLVQNVGVDPPSVSAAGYYLASAPQAGDIGVLLVTNFANFSIVFNYWNNDTWHGNEKPMMVGDEFAEFTAVSLFQGEELMFYGLTSDGDIQVFTIDRRDPLTWTYDQMADTHVTGLAKEARSLEM